ncbi:THAP domain-containing protein 3-like isoform X1 [Podarcis raffonei]|uniref:THAP domain-containing protein 3-like isoform X1 n=2 Tax=Podarcis raffonei TaxID=65483 RepID=UPI0023291F23|nr:THAP domain-containing protein 3-like isoform X1 [Podarcis raffonei]
MVKYCAAYNCTNSDTKLNRKQGITFHRFPKDNARKQEWAMSVHRADPVSGKLWMPSQWDMICSQHFSPECFREINGKKFLKEESCPSIFSFPDTSKKIHAPKRRRKNSKWAGALDLTLVKANGSKNEMCSQQIMQTTPASDSQKSLEHKEHKVDLNSFSSKISPTEVYSAKYTLTTEHHYHITDSPKTLKRKLDEILEENDELRRRLRNRPPKEQ